MTLCMARIIAASGYSKCLSLEVSIRHAGIGDETGFLAKAYKTGLCFSRMVDEHRASPHST
jgi:hypothetical protein